MSQQFFSSQSHVETVTKELSEAVEQLQRDYPEHKISLVSNRHHCREDIQHTYTLCASGPVNSELQKALIDIRNNPK